MYLVIATTKHGHSIHLATSSYSKAIRVKDDGNKLKINITFTVKTFDLAKIDLDKLMKEEE
jgi:hypothetical protein